MKTIIYLQRWLFLFFLTSGICELLNLKAYYEMKGLTDLLGKPVPIEPGYWKISLSFLLAASFLHSTWKEPNPAAATFAEATPNAEMAWYSSGAIACLGFFGLLLSVCLAGLKAKGAEAYLPELVWMGFLLGTSIFFGVLTAKAMRRKRMQQSDNSVLSQVQS